jgi:hypothetical protein
MKQVDLQKLVNLAVIMELHISLLKMLDPVETCILNFRRKALFHLATLDISCKHTRGAQATDISLKGRGHKPYTVLGQHPMCMHLVHPEVRISAAVFVKEEVAK